MQIELIQLSLSQQLSKRQSIDKDMLSRLRLKYPRVKLDYFDNPLNRKDLIKQYESEIVRNQIETQLVSLCQYAFSARKVPKLCAVVGFDLEKTALLSEIMALRNK